MLKMIQFLGSGEVIVVNPANNACSRTLHYTEQDHLLDEYDLSEWLSKDFDEDMYEGLDYKVLRNA